MPTILNWPERGEWLLGNPKSPIGRNAGGFYRKSDPPFAVLTVHFKSKTGTIRQWKTTESIGSIRLRQSADGPKFSAAYAIGTNSGNFEATVFNKYELEIEFTGTAVTCVNACPTSIDGGDVSIGSWSTEDKLREATRRALPLMPDEVRREVEALFTPQAIAIMAALAGLWAASHLAVVGGIADVALLITGGLLLGKAAWDVGTHLAGFLTKAVGAETEADLDAAAQDFAAAVLLGGVLVVGTILMSKPAKGSAQRLRPPAKPGALPAEMNMVPPSRIPPASRVGPQLTKVGEEPRLPGLAQDAAQLVRGLLNRIRGADLKGQGMDCCAGSEALDAASGNRGIVREGTSGASGPARVSDHTMWEFGDEFVDTRPGWWRDLFKRDPAARAAVNQAVPGLAERLEAGAVLTRAEHKLFQAGAPRPGAVRPTPHPGGRKAAE